MSGERTGETVQVRKEVLGELTESARRWQNKAHTERRKGHRWRRRALAAEGENERLRRLVDDIEAALSAPSGEDQE